jgi:hypothetical protein
MDSFDFFLLGTSLREINCHVKSPCNPSTQEVEAGGLQVGGQPWLHSENLFQKKKKTLRAPCAEKLKPP